ncbi:MAG: hypothetical protein VX000_07065, partial [Myxococcota bacterium]|nr:hypothetical protein [Myxococcota bacterium]
MATALAHDGRPVTDDLTWSGEDLAVAATTHGLLFQAPDGHWNWVCDEAWGDHPRTALLSTAAVTWVATTGGAAWSTDGCTWTRAPELEDVVVLSLWEDARGGLMAASPDALLRAGDASSAFSMWARAPEGIVLRAAARSDGDAVWALGFDGDIPAAWRVEDGHWNPIHLPALGNRIEPLWTDPDGALLARLPSAYGDDRLVRVDPAGGVGVLVDTRLPIRAAWVEQSTFYVSVEALGTMRSDDHGASWTAPSGPALACHYVRDGQRIA